MPYLEHVSSTKECLYGRSALIRANTVPQTPTGCHPNTIVSDMFARHWCNGYSVWYTANVMQHKV